MTRPTLAALLTTAAAALALLLLLSAPAAAWQRVATVAELCAEASARPIVRTTIVRGRGRDGPIEFVQAPCTIVVARGAVLRLADLSLSLLGDGGRDNAALAILLRDGAGLELARSRVSAYSTNIDGWRSGGPVRLINSHIAGTITTASISSAADVSLRSSSIDVLRGGGLASLNGSVEMVNSGIGGRNGVYIAAGPGGVGVQRSALIGGLGGVYLEALRGGGVTVVESTLGFAAITLTPTAAGRSGAVVLAGNEVSAPEYVPEHVVFELSPEAGCYAVDNEPEVACPAPAP